jgi:hypothetical protein
VLTSYTITPSSLQEDVPSSAVFLLYQSCTAWLKERDKPVIVQFGVGQFPSGTKVPLMYRLCGAAEQAAEKVGFWVESRKMHVPGAKALVDAAPVMPGLKSRPILKLDQTNGTPLH